MEISPSPIGLTEGISEIVSSIFENMLGLPATLDESPLKKPMELSSRVGFWGSWRGVVILECARQDARRFAASFLSLPDNRIDDGIACDVLGELTNMIAGNLKPAFALDIQLSHVEYLSGNDGPPIEFAPTFRERLLFRCGEAALVVKVLALPEPILQAGRPE